MSFKVGLLCESIVTFLTLENINLHILVIITVNDLSPENSSPYYEYFANASEDLMIWKMICDKTCRSKAALPCEFLYVGSGWLIWEKFCHKTCIDISCWEEIIVTNDGTIEANADTA